MINKIIIIKLTIFTSLEIVKIREDFKDIENRDEIKNLCNLENRGLKIRY